MAETYDIRWQNEIAGTVRAEKQGLYHCFHCRCSLPDDGMYRIHVCSGDKWEDLGICIPVEGKFGMDKKIPQKRLGEGELTFRLVPKDWQPEEPTVEPESSAQKAIVAEPVMAEEPEQEVAGEPEQVITEEPEEIFIPVSEEEPFRQMDMLENAVMEVRDEQPGIVIQE